MYQHIQTGAQQKKFTEMCLKMQRWCFLPYDCIGLCPLLSIFQQTIQKSVKCAHTHGCTYTTHRRTYSHKTSPSSLMRRLFSTIWCDDCNGGSDGEIADACVYVRVCGYDYTHLHGTAKRVRPPTNSTTQVPSIKFRTTLYSKNLLYHKHTRTYKSHNILMPCSMTEASVPRVCFLPHMKSNRP